MPGCLYLCATPIGNLEDITYRCVRVLGEVDIIAAEDTRQTAKLLNHYKIKKPMISYHEHNKREKGIELANMMLQGKNIALVSDAGMPAISDPGEDLVKLCLEKEISIVPLPGASASITALVISGFSTKRFCFEGFLSINKKERRERLNLLAVEPRTIIIYEAPHKLLGTLDDIMKHFGNREISISRELTKKFEETMRGNIEEAIEFFSEKGIKGEFVLVIKGINEKELIDIEQERWHNITIEEHLLLYYQQGFTKKEAIGKVAEDRKLPKKEVYKVAIDIWCSE